MEKNQERGLRFVYGDYTLDYDSLLCKSKLPSLKLGRERNIAIQTYKIKNNLAPTYLKELITLIQNSKMSPAFIQINKAWSKFVCLYGP